MGSGGTGSRVRLEIGTRAGANDISDSQEISVTRRFLYDLPAGKALHGRVSANVGGRWEATDFVFSVGQPSAPEPHWIESAIWATGVVREMADPGDLAVRLDQALARRPGPRVHVRLLLRVCNRPALHPGGYGHPRADENS